MLTDIRDRLIEVRDGIISSPTSVGPVKVPGIGTGAAYAALDAFGIVGIFENVPRKGTIIGALFHDIDNEKLAKDLFLSVRPFVGTADNSAFAPLKADILNCIGVISWTASDYVAFNANAIGRLTNIGIPYNAPNGVIYFQFMTQGADNIAAGSEPFVTLLII